MRLGSLLSPGGSPGGLTRRLSGPLLDSDPGSRHARAGGLAIEFPFGKHIELLVRRLLLLQVRLQKAKDVVMAKLFRPGDQCPVARNLIVLDGLCTADDGGIEYLLVVDLSCDVVRLLDQPVHRRAVCSCGGLTERLERLVEPAHLLLGFSQMIAQA